MDAIEVTIPSKIHHISQIITGFLLLQEQGWNVTLVDRSDDARFPLYDLPVVLATYRGRQLVYDLWDGYQNPEGMRLGLERCDFYFKRSFSAEKNRQLFPEFAERMYPLGFNYHLTHPRNPINEPLWKHFGKCLQGRAPDRYFRPGVFEGTVTPKEGEAVRILFLARLWDSHDPTLSAQANEERSRINDMRIEIIRTLRQRYADSFLGGLNDTSLSRTMAPDLIVPRRYTERKHYLNLLHSCDICIGTMGLHESTGWKTGEYVAAAKAIVNEAFRYTVPGDFVLGKNYLDFTTAQECISAVGQLVEDPQRLLAMKQANAAYYQRYLKPDVLVKNTLAQVDRSLSEAGAS